jgi:hypothetical protein
LIAGTRPLSWPALMPAELLPAAAVIEKVPFALALHDAVKG